MYYLNKTNKCHNTANVVYLYTCINNHHFKTLSRYKLVIWTDELKFKFESNHIWKVYKRFKMRVFVVDRINKYHMNENVLYLYTLSLHLQCSLLYMCTYSCQLCWRSQQSSDSYLNHQCIRLHLYVTTILVLKIFVSK